VGEQTEERRERCVFLVVAGTKIAAHNAAHLFELFFLGIKYKGFFRNEIDQSHRFRPCHVVITSLIQTN
jgi:hypothetical protein